MGKKKILIIDDEIDFTNVLKINLELTGKYEVRVENKGANGLAGARAFKPHLIFLDIIMPDLEGSVVASQIKSDENIKDIPIVFLTAAITEEEADSKTGLIGGHPFVAKPASLEQLIDVIEKNAC